MTFRYGVDRLDLDTVNGIANGSVDAVLTSEAISKINTSRQRVDKMAASDLSLIHI